MIYVKSLISLWEEIENQLIILMLGTKSITPIGMSANMIWYHFVHTICFRTQKKIWDRSHLLFSIYNPFLDVIRGMMSFLKLNLNKILFIVLDMKLSI